VTTQVNLVLPAPGSAIQHGQTAISVTDTAVQIASSQAGCITVAVKALSGNGASIYVGGSGVTTSNGWELAAGESWEIDIDHAEYGIYINGTAGDGCCWAVLQK
jgi:hypothetical protein